MRFFVMPIHPRTVNVHSKHRRGMTLLLTMLAVALAVTFLSRQMLQTTVLRMSASSKSFAIESQWIALGVATQWQERSRDEKLDIDNLLKPVSWDMPSIAASPEVHIDIIPSSSQSKLYLPAMEEADWVSFWQKEPSNVTLCDEPGRKLLESGDTALEVILGPKHITTQDAYMFDGQQAVPSDFMTVWGDGHLDLNRASREVLKARLKTFTDAQISGILRVRATGPMKDLTAITNELNPSDDQNQLLSEIATFAPSSLELVIKIRKGGLSCVYFAVLSVGKTGQVLELRPIE